MCCVFPSLNFYHDIFESLFQNGRRKDVLIFSQFLCYLSRHLTKQLNNEISLKDGISSNGFFFLLIVFTFSKL
ncbi:hypothetical protein BpHYR1_028083 [Brachionus plicatilis]|uniref:Uncharacterized protein n=1 Tax=Brachionus plicatilis TaxID=10195 RepID=A0A3M7QNU8_BRAPC|nr:hypothetical protein BpHYR1_028083 [Brachionus plicatilis]